MCYVKNLSFFMGCKVTHFYQSTTLIKTREIKKNDCCFEKYFSFIFTKN